MVVADGNLMGGKRMKKYVLLAAVALMALAVTHTDSMAAKRTIKQVHFRYKIGAGSGVELDSTYAHRAANRTDTTAVFTLANRTVGMGVAAMVDSTQNELFTVHFGATNGSSIAVGSGTTTFGVQGSVDGAQWTTVAGWAAVTITATGTGEYQKVFVPSTTVVDSRYPFYRLIIVSAATGVQQCYISYLVAD
jgi:hypothetical protein